MKMLFHITLFAMSLQWPCHLRTCMESTCTYRSADNRYEQSSIWVYQQSSGWTDGYISVWTDGYTYGCTDNEQMVICMDVQITNGCLYIKMHR